MFKIEVRDEHYNKLFFKLETLEEVEHFISTVFEAADDENTKGLMINVEYKKTYKMNEEE